MKRFFVISVFVVLAVGASLADAQTNFVSIDGDVTPVGDWDDEYCIEDVDGCDDEPGQRDSKYACVASNYFTVQPADTLFLRFDFDDTGFTGANTGDGCWLLDTDDDQNVNAALCFTLSGSPATLDPADVQLYSCNDSMADRCAGSVALPASSPVCLLDVDAPDATSCNAGPDAAVECSVPIPDIGSLTAGTVLLGACTFPSEVPNSAPSDCVNDSGSPFIVDPFSGTSIPVELVRFTVE
jgi:hypothetical protein